MSLSIRVHLDCLVIVWCVYELLSTLRLRRAVRTLGRSYSFSSLAGSMRLRYDLPTPHSVTSSVCCTHYFNIGEACTRSCWWGGPELPLSRVYNLVSPSRGVTDSGLGLQSLYGYSLVGAEVPIPTSSKLGSASALVRTVAFCIGGSNHGPCRQQDPSRQCPGRVYPSCQQDSWRRDPGRR